MALEGMLSPTRGFQNLLAVNRCTGIALIVHPPIELIPQLLEHGTVLRSWLGVNIQVVTSDLAKAFDLSGPPRGALVCDVVAGSPAQKAGLKPGDRIFSVDGRKIIRAADLREAVAGHYAGETISIVILRGDREFQTKIELTRPPETKKRSPKLHQNESPLK